MVDDLDTIGNDVFPLPVLVYSHPSCDNTGFVRDRLQTLRIPFVEINIDEDLEARRYVEHINHGECLTPTLVFGNEDFIVVEPDLGELNQALRRAGYEA